MMKKITFFIVLIFSFHVETMGMKEFGVVITNDNVIDQNLRPVYNVVRNSRIAHSNILFSSFNNTMYINNVYPVGRGGNVLNNFALTEVCDLLHRHGHMIDYNYRDISDDLMRISTLIPTINTYDDYIDNLPEIFLDEDLYLNGYLPYEPDQLAGINIADILLRVHNIAEITGDVDRLNLDAISLRDIETFANSICRSIMDSFITTYVWNFIGAIVPIPPVTIHNIFLSFRPFWNYAHTEYEALYDITHGDPMHGNIPQDIVLISRLDMCNPASHSLFLGCERLWACRLSAQTNPSTVNVTSFREYFNTRRVMRDQHQQTDRLRLHFDSII